MMNRMATMPNGELIAIPQAVSPICLASAHSLPYEALGRRRANSATHSRPQFLPTIRASRRTMAATVAPPAESSHYAIIARAAFSRHFPHLAALEMAFVCLTDCH